MADDNIDKALPNVEQTIELPSEEELVEAAQSEEDKVPNPENTEIVQGEDGSVEINFDPPVPRALQKVKITMRT